MFILMMFIFLLAGLSACSAKTPESVKPGPSETAAERPGSGAVPPESTPPESTPPEAAPPEAAPPEAAPPEAAPPETAPPEAAPPETAPPEAAPIDGAASSQESQPALRQLGWGPWSAELSPGYRGNLTFRNESRCMLEIDETSNIPDASVGYEGDYEIIFENEGGNKPASIHFTLYKYWTKGDAAVFDDLPYELDGDYILDLDAADSYVIGMRLARGDALFSLGGVSPSAYVFEQVYWYDPPTSPAIRDYLTGSWTCDRPGGLVCRMDIAQNDFNGDLGFVVDFFNPDGGRAYGRYLEGHITSSSWWDDNPDDSGEITIYIHGKAMDPESYRLWESGEGRKPTIREGKLQMGLYALQDDSLFNDVDNGEDASFFLFEKEAG